MALFNQTIKDKPPFEEWYKTVPKEIADTNDYDLKSAYENLPYEDMEKWKRMEQHLPDTYKKPSHITFSQESVYNDANNKGGYWEDNKFYATELNIRNAGGVDELKAYFAKYEPEAELVIDKDRGKKAVSMFVNSLTNPSAAVMDATDLTNEKTNIAKSLAMPEYAHNIRNDIMTGHYFKPTIEAPLNNTFRPMFNFLDYLHDKWDGLFNKYIK